MPSDKKKNGVALADKKNGHSVAAAGDNKNYRPSDNEPFMNERQREYFPPQALFGKTKSSRRAARRFQHLQAENENHPDLADRASSETDRALELRTRDRQRKLIAKIDAALRAHRGRHLRLLRGDRRADRAETARCPADRDPVDRGAGASRAARAGLSRRLRTFLATRIWALVNSATARGVDHSRLYIAGINKRRPLQSFMRDRAPHRRPCCA